MRRFYAHISDQLRTDGNLWLPRIQFNRAELRLQGCRPRAQDFDMALTLAAAHGSDMFSAPQVLGTDDAGVRLLPRRHGAASAALRAHLH